MNKMLNKKNIPSFVLYFVAALLMIYAVMGVYQLHERHLTGKNK